MSRTGYGRLLFQSSRNYYRLNFLQLLRSSRKTVGCFRRSWIEFKKKRLHSRVYFLSKSRIFNYLKLYLKSSLLLLQIKKINSIVNLRNKADFFNSNKPVIVKWMIKWRQNLLIQHFGYLVRRLEKQRTIYPKNEFFYMVHIASPKPQRPRRSVFALKQMYLRKLGVYMGFDRLTKFVRTLRILSGARSSRIRTFGFFESRLCIILLRVNFFTSIYLLRKLIENGYIMVNNRPIFNPDYLVRPSEIVTVERCLAKRVYGSLLSRLRHKRVLINHPHHLEVDYKLLAVMMVKYPDINCLTAPASFDLSGTYPFAGGIV